MHKILFYINTIGSGGAERVIKNLAEQFAKKGYECILVTSLRCENEYILNDKVKRISLFENRIDGFFRRNSKLISALKAVLKKEKPNLVVSFMGECNYRAIIASKSLRIKCIVSVRNDPNMEYSSFFKKTIAKVLYSKADGIVFQTKEAQEWFPNKIQKKSRIILNQVDDVFLKTQIPPKRKDIVCVGRLVEQKNHKLLILAFKQISNIINENLIIYGDGPLREDLISMIKKEGLEEKVMIVGNKSDLCQYIKTAKLFVLSSDYEGLPNSLLEAMSLGIPCISTDCPCGGPRMVIKNGINGFLTPVGDVDALSKKICYVLEDDMVREAIGLNAKEYSLKTFDSNIVFKEWEDYFLTILNYGH